MIKSKLYKINRSNFRLEDSLNKRSTKANHRYGIDTKKMTPLHRSLFLNRLYLKEIAHDDRMLNIIFNTVNMEVDKQLVRNSKIYYIKELNVITQKKNIELLNKIDIWNCSFCNEKIILSEDQRITHRDMLCDDCKENYTKIKYVDGRIIENYKSYILHKNNSLIKRYDTLFKNMKEINKRKKKLEKIKKKLNI